MNDFQTKHRLYKYDEATSTEWHQPSAYTFRNLISRVSVTPSTEQSSTLFVILSNPALEEIVIKNRTDEELTVAKYNKRLGQPFGAADGAIAARSNAVFAWDSTDITDKWLYVRAGATTGAVSLEQVSQLDSNKAPLKKLLFVLGRAPDAVHFYTRLKLTEQGTKILEVLSQEKQEESKEQVAAEEDDELVRMAGRVDNGFSL